ncbi:DUF262 domain-containing protein [Nocardia sp. NPDC005998]|uniref:DUF262 domain-containing protein n=1 Tax=Nocardia sp. NPDC005998 TaxID=3156894 RepID=UPI0033BA5E58
MTTTTETASAIGPSIRDLATNSATWTIRQETVGEYLTRFAVYDPATRTIAPGNIPDSVYQRAKIEIGKNAIKKRMLRDLLRGGTLPAVVIVEGEDGRYEIADGLQRTHVLTVAAEGLLALEQGEQPSREVRTQLNAMADLGQQPLDLDAFLARPLMEQVWHDLDSDEKLRLFMVLNVGQQKVSPRHLLEVAQSDVRNTFESWNIKLLTEREEKETPRPRGRRPKDAPAAPTEARYRYELLIDSLQAYVSSDPHIKTRKLVEDGPSEKFDTRITEVGSEACRDDFKWVCLELNHRIQERYEGHPKWEMAVQASDNFLIPLFAALGKARDEADTGSTVQHHQQELLELFDQPGDDPLNLMSGPDSLEAIYETIRSNIGRKQRAIAYFAWRNFFSKGPSRADYPLNWRDAEIGS